MKVLAYVGTLVLFTALSFPLSAGAFGRAPSSSEVNRTAPAKTAAKTSSTSTTTTTDSNGASGTVPEPSSVVLLAVAFGIIAVVSLKRRFGQTVKK